MLSLPAVLPTYSCFDFRLRSQIALKELMLAEDAGDPRPIVDVLLGNLPETLPASRSTDFGLQVSDRGVMLTVTGIARYLVRGRTEIIVDRMPGASDRDVRLFLLGSALGILCYNRDMLPLHASAVVCGGGAMAFAGPSGVGKSTLVAHFARAGYEVLTDDVCAVGFDSSGEPEIWPALPRLKLWGDAAEAFGLDKASLAPVTEGVHKYHVPIARRAVARPVPLRRLYVLSNPKGEARRSIIRLRGTQAMQAVMAQTYRAIFLVPMGLRRRHFVHCAALLDHIEVYRAGRQWGYDAFECEARRLERHVLNAGR